MKAYWSCCGVFYSLLIITRSAEAPPPSANAGDMFLTTVAEQEMMVNGRTIKRWVPGETNLSFVWSDQPFAVHIPFNLETKIEFGRVQSKPYRISAWMHGFGTTTNYGGRSAPSILTAGIYRFDGQPVLQGESNRFYFYYDMQKLRSMAVLPEGYPVTTNTWMPTVFLRGDLLGPARYAVWMVMDPRPRWVSERYEPVLSQTERVTEVHGIPAAAWATNEFLKGVLNFVFEEVAVDPSKYAPTPGEFGVPQGARPPPAPATKGWKRTTPLEIKVKQNGWQLRSIVVTKNADLASLRYSGDGGVQYEHLELGEKFEPPTFTTMHRVTARDTNQAPKTTEKTTQKPTEKAADKVTDIQVVVKFPEKLFDHGLQWAPVDMQQVGRPGGTPSYARYGLAPQEGITLTAHPFKPKDSTNAAYADVLDRGDRFTAYLRNSSDSIDTNTGLSAERLWIKFPSGARGSSPYNAERGGTMPGFWTADKKLPAPHVLLSLDLKFNGTLKSIGTNVIKHVDFLATRLSESEENRTGSVTREAPSEIASLPDDGYHDWLVRFHQERDKTEQRLQEIGMELSTRYGEQQALRAKWFKMLWYDMKAWPADPADQDDLIVSAVRFVGRGLTSGKGIPLEPTIVKSMLDDLKRERDGIQPKIDASRKEQAALIAEGTKLSKMLVENVDSQTVASRENDQHLAEVNRTLDHTKDQHDLNRLRLLDAAGWHGTPEMQQLLDEMKFSSTAARELTKIMEAKGWLARAKSLDMRLAVAIISPSPVKPNSEPELQAHAARMEAMRALHEAITVASNSIQARAILKTTELEMLAWIQRKLDQDRALSMAGFHHYLSARGYNPGQAKDWWDGFKELNSAFWGSSPVTLGGALPWSNTAGQVADDTIMVQDAIAKNQVSIFAIQRLIRSGMTLKEIRNVSADQLSERLMFQTFDRTTLDKAKAHRICQDIHETFAELYDLRALAEGNIDEFQKFIQRTYYSSFDGSKTWSESIGDFFFSPLGLVMMFGPSAVAKVDGKWVASVPKGELGLLEEAGRLERMRDVFATTCKLEELGRRFTSTRIGGMLADAVIADQKFLASRSLLERFLNGGARLAATVTIYCGAAELADESGVPGLRMLVDAVGMLGAEEMAFDILSRNGTPLRKLLTKCDDFGRILASEGNELAQLEKSHAQLEEIQKRLAARKQPGALPAPNPQELKQIEEALAALPPPKKGTLKVAGTDKKEDARNTLKNAADALKKGDTAEAQRALKGAKAMQGEMKQTLDAYGMALAKARENLSKNPALRQIMTSEQLKPIAKIPGNPPNFAPAGGYPSGPAGIALKYGDEAVQKGKLNEALDFYRHAFHHAEKSQADDVARLIEERLALLADATSEAETFAIIRRGPPRAPPSAQAVEEKHLTEMLGDISAGKLEVVPNPNPSANPVYFIKSKTDGKLSYVFKALDNPDVVACEVFGPLAAQRLELNSAQARRATMRVPRIKNGQEVLINGQRVFDEVEGFIVRAAEGPELSDFTEAVILALKEDYAKQRVLRLWLGDTDGHLRNILLTPEGRLLPIDFDFASLKKDGILRQLMDRQTASQKEFLETALEMPALIRKYNSHLQNAPLYTWLDRIDGMLSYDEMAESVKRIKDLCAEKNGETLKGMLRQAMPESKVTEAFQALTERAGLLEEVLKKKFPHFKKTASLQPGRFQVIPLFAPEFEVIALAA